MASLAGSNPAPPYTIKKKKKEKKMDANLKIIMLMTFISMMVSLAEGNEGDNHIIAKTLFLEAQGEGEEGIRAVATVIWNRAFERKLSLANVCLQKLKRRKDLFEFSCWNKNKGNFNFLIDYSNPVWMLCLKVESEMMSKKFVPLGTWNLYHNPKLCSPSWTENGTFDICYIGNHKFETERRG